MKPNYYAIIPATVRYDRDLPPNAKLLYGEITALSNQEGYCWANNVYFAELYGVSKITISRWIKALIDKGYVTSKIKYKKGTKQISERRIYINQLMNSPINKNVNTPIQKSIEPINKNVNTPINKNVKDNSTSINNTNNKYISKYVEKESEKLKEISKLYQENIGVINGIVAEELLLISEEIDPALFKEAIKIATDKSKCNFGYIKGILNQWKKNNINTLTDLEALRVQKKNISKNSNKGKEGNHARVKSNNAKNEKSVQEKVKELLERKGKTFKDYL